MPDVRQLHAELASVRADLDNAKRELQSRAATPTASLPEQELARVTAETAKARAELDATDSPYHARNRDQVQE